MRIISGQFRSRRIATPKGNATRPTPEALRERLFNICQHDLEGAAVLDLFSGSGALALEAVSRGAESAICVENGKEAIRCIKKNIRELDVGDSVQLLTCDVFVALTRLEKQERTFGIILADPPYHATLSIDGEEIAVPQHVLNILDESPLLEAGGSLFLERSRDVPLQLSQLTTLTHVSSRKIGGTILEQFRREKPS